MKNQRTHGIGNFVCGISKFSGGFRGVNEGGWSWRGSGQDPSKTLRQQKTKISKSGQIIDKYRKLNIG